MKEIWKPIPDFPMYQISTLGCVKFGLPVAVAHGLKTKRPKEERSQNVRAYKGKNIRGAQALAHTTKDIKTMKPGHGKQKGSSFERKICTMLSLKVTDGKRKDVFWRSSLSGGRATIHKKGEVRQAGDICAVAPEGHAFTDRYYLECKHYRNLLIDRFLIERKGPLEKFWKVACREAKKYHREPVLIAKQNNRPIIAVIGTFRHPTTMLFTTWLKEQEVT